MPIEQLVNKFPDLQKVMAAQVTVYDFFTKEKHAITKTAFLELFRRECHYQPQQDTLFSEEAIAAAWITKLRFNQQMSNEQFMAQIMRAEAIFTGKADSLALHNKSSDPTNNDTVAFMWGIEALNGIQSADEGATRIRLADGVAAKILKTLEENGAKQRISTHATCTKLLKKGLGKDIENEALRQFTPRGVGAILVHPTSRNGDKPQLQSSSNAQLPSDGPLHQRLGDTDYDLLLKCEPYGCNDRISHTLVHSKMGFINKFARVIGNAMAKGKKLIAAKLELALACEETHGVGAFRTRKEHLSELKEQSTILIDILNMGKKQTPRLFDDFQTKLTIRMKWLPFEMKIVGKNGKKVALGDFLQQVAAAERANHTFAHIAQQQLNSVRGLLVQSTENTGMKEFAKTREGDEVLVDCSSGKSILCDPIAKSSTSPGVVLDKDLSTKELTILANIGTEIAREEYNNSPLPSLAKDALSHKLEI